MIGLTSTLAVNSWVWLFQITALPVIILSYVSRITDGFLATIVAPSSIDANTCDGLESTVTLVNSDWLPKETVSPFLKNWLVLTLTYTTLPLTLAIVPVVLEVCPSILWLTCISVPPLPASWNWYNGKNSIIWSLLPNLFSSPFAFSILLVTVFTDALERSMIGERLLDVEDNCIL